MNLYKFDQHDFYYCEQCKNEIPNDVKSWMQQLQMVVIKDVAELILRYLLVHVYSPLHKQLFVQKVSQTQYIWMLFEVNVNTCKIKMKYVIEDHPYRGYAASPSQDTYKRNSWMIEYDFSNWQLELYRNPILAQVRTYLHQFYAPLHTLYTYPPLFWCELHSSEAKSDISFALSSFN